MVEGERVRITSPQPSLFLLSVWKEAGEQTSVELDVNSRPSLLPSLTTVEPCESCRACPNIYKHSPGALPTWLCGQIHWKRLGGGCRLGGTSQIPNKHGLCGGNQTYRNFPRNTPHPRMLIRALLIIRKSWKYLKCPSTGDWLGEVSYIRAGRGKPCTDMGNMPTLYYLAERKRKE